MKQFLKYLFLVLALSLGFVGKQVAYGQNVDTLLRVFDDMTEQLLYRNNDTNYIKNHSDKLAVRLVTNSKFNYFRLIDRSSRNSLKYRPVRGLSLGVGVAYKFFAFDLTVGLKVGDQRGLEDNRSLDFQGRVFSSKQFVSATLQYYHGYKLSDVNGDHISEEREPTDRKDLRTVNLQLQYMYAFNYTKFSMKAPFVFNERQKKSAGSTIIGTTFSMFNVDADSSIIPVELDPYFSPESNLKSLFVMNLGIRFGYMYTYVLKDHFFITASLNPGLVLNYGDYSVDSRNNLPTTLNLSLNTMNAIGYNGHKFFAGISLMYDIFNTKVDTYTRIQQGSGKASLFVGYRFRKE